MKFKITITKEVIDKSLMCGTQKEQSKRITTNCAFAVAYNELIPRTNVFHDSVCFDDINGIAIRKLDGVIFHRLSFEQKDFIYKFDLMDGEPHQRYTLVGQTFDVEIPDEVIEYWHGDAVTAAQKLIDNPIMQTV